MSDHEQVHEALEREADALEGARRRLDDSIEDAKAARERNKADDLIAHEPPDEPDQSGPESDYPTLRT